MSNYFPLQQAGRIDPLLNTQLKLLHACHTEQKLGKQLGQAVALELIAKYLPAREFALQALKDALDAEVNAPRPSVYRYLNNTPAGRDAATFLYYNIPISQAYVIPEPTVFIKAFLSELKPPKVPSDEWDEEYQKVKDIGRADWPGPTPEMNQIAVHSGCLKANGVGADPLTTCNAEVTWDTVVRASLPTGTSLYDTVSLFAKLHVAIHDNLIVLFTLQYGFWFWRPEMAFKAGDPRHAPIPTWKPHIGTPPHAEYPSGSAAGFAVAKTILEDFIGKNVPFTQPAGGVWGPGCPVQGPVPSLTFNSFEDYLKFMKKSRVYCDAHFNKSVEDGVKVGERVARYVVANWGEGTPAGVLPHPTYLNVFAQLPKLQTGFNPIRLVY